MDGRTVTNILLAIIAGSLLFGGGAMLGGLKVGFWVAVVLLILFGIFWVIYKVIKSMADEMRKEKTIVGKALVPALYLGLAGLLISSLRLASLMIESESWNIYSAMEKLIGDPWGVPIILFLMCAFTWSMGEGLGKMGKSFFSSQKAQYRIDAVRGFVSAWVLLPFYLSVKQYQRAVAEEQEPISAAAVALVYGFVVWLFTIGIALMFAVSAFQNVHRDP